MQERAARQGERHCDTVARVRIVIVRVAVKREKECAQFTFYKLLRKLSSERQVLADNDDATDGDEESHR